MYSKQLKFAIVKGGRLERSLIILKEPSQQTLQRLLAEADDNCAKFLKSPLGVPFTKTAHPDDVNFIIETFTGTAYMGDGRTPKRWTAETAGNVIASYFPQFMEFDVNLIGQVVPILVNYFSFLEHDLHYIKNSAALTKAAFTANCGLVAAYAAGPAELSDDEMDSLAHGELGEEFLNRVSPEELEQMKQAYTVLLQEQQQGTLDDEGEKMLKIIDSVLSREDGKSPLKQQKPAGHPQMKLHKKPKKSE